MPQLLQDLWECAIGMFTGRISGRAVASALNVNASTISRLRCQFEEFGTTEPSTCPSTLCDDPCLGPLYLDPSSHPRSPLRSHSHHRWDSRSTQSQWFRLKRPENDGWKTIPVHVVLDVNWISPLMNDDNDLLRSGGTSAGRWKRMFSLVTSHVSSSTEQIGGSVACYCW